MLRLLPSAAVLSFLCSPMVHAALPPPEFARYFVDNTMNAVLHHLDYSIIGISSTGNTSVVENVLQFTGGTSFTARRNGAPVVWSGPVTVTVDDWFGVADDMLLDATIACADTELAVSAYAYRDFSSGRLDMDLAVVRRVAGDSVGAFGLYLVAMRTENPGDTYSSWSAQVTDDGIARDVSASVHRLVLPNGHVQVDVTSSSTLDGQLFMQCDETVDALVQSTASVTQLEYSPAGGPSLVLGPNGGTVIARFAGTDSAVVDLHVEVQPVGDVWEPLLLSAHASTAVVGSAAALLSGDDGWSWADFWENVVGGAIAGAAGAAITTAVAAPPAAPVTGPPAYVVGGAAGGVAGGAKYVVTRLLEDAWDFYFGGDAPVRHDSLRPRLAMATTRDTVYGVVEGFGNFTTARTMATGSVSAATRVADAPDGGGAILRVVPISASGAAFDFTLTAPQRVSLDLVDATGRRIATLVDGEALDPGTHRRRWSGRTAAGGDAPAGIYFCRLRAGDDRVVRRVALLAPRVRTAR